MIGNITPAGAPTNVINSEQASLQLFGPASTSQTSAQFTVDQHPFTLAAFNLGSDDVITIQQVVYQGTSQLVSTYQPVYGPAVMDTHRSKFIIEQPGRYQLHHTGSSSLGTFAVLGGAYASTSMGIAELAAALQAVIVNTGLVVTGTSPIVVTGTGPYNISTPDIIVAGDGSEIAIGHNATTTGSGSITMGLSATANTDSIGIGGAAVVSGSTSVGIGKSVQATGNLSVAVGGGALATGLHAVGVGEAADGAGVGAVAIGPVSNAHNDYTISIGANAGSGDNTHTNVIVIASKSTATTATQNDQIILGTSTQTQLVTAGSIIQGGVISASDERLKKNLQLEENVLEQLAKLDPVTFEWDRAAVEKANGVMNEEEYNKKQHGLIAQEVKEVFPEIVAEVDRGSGPYLYVHYERLISVLVAGIQELTSRVKELEAKQNG